jgi:hypothetical protein
MGFPTELEIISTAEDTTPPQLVQLSFTPTTIDVSSTTQHVTVTVRITDDLSGSSQPWIRFESPSGTQVSDALGDVVSGDPEDRIYDSVHTFPVFSESGTWHLDYIDVSDAVGNHRRYTEADLITLGFPTVLEVVSATPDTQPPELIDFSFSPTTIDVSTTTQHVAATLRITDDLSGSSQPQVWFISPSGTQTSYALGDIVSGDPTDRVYESLHTFPVFSEPGTWHIDYIDVSDAVGNARRYTEADMISLSFPTELEVISGPIDTDGDGFPDNEDACPNSDLDTTVVIDGCDSGVDNALFGDGCTISDTIAELASTANNHGSFVSAVAHYTNDLKKGGVITGEDKEAIQSCAGQAGILKPPMYEVLLTYSTDDEGNSWIHIQLMDKHQRPVALEDYELFLPDGRVAEGTLDENGEAHVLSPVPGSAMINFPNLDSWERV